MKEKILKQMNQKQNMMIWKTKTKRWQSKKSKNQLGFWILLLGKNRGAIAIDSGVEIGLYFSHSHITFFSLIPDQNWFVPLAKKIVISYKSLYGALWSEKSICGCALLIFVTVIFLFLTHGEYPFSCLTMSEAFNIVTFQIRKGKPYPYFKDLRGLFI